MDSYPWRVALVDYQDTILARMKGIAPHLEEKDFADIISTCDSIDRGTSGQDLVDDTMTRFSGGAEEHVDASQAEKLVELSKQVCPR